MHASYFNRYRLSVDLFAFVEDSPFLSLRLYLPFLLGWSSLPSAVDLSLSKVETDP